jgi:chaperone required for assembly of F1-ATPase
MKRFYKAAQSARSDTGFVIHLDGKPVRTPAGLPLTLGAFDRLAHEIAAEWDAQEQEIKPATMPLTQLAATALDRVGPERPAIIEQMVAYARTDLLCYRADAPQALTERQHRLWQPVLDKTENRLGCRFAVTAGIIAVDQPPETIAAVEDRLQALDVWTLTVAQATAAASGSTVLALALVEGDISAADVFDLSQVDENWQIELWGEDAEATRRREALARDIAAAGRLLELIQTTP